MARTRRNASNTVYFALEVQMQFEVSIEARNAAEKCPTQMACLHSKDARVCRVKACVGDDVLFVAPRPTHSCPYKVSFGNS